MDTWIAEYRTIQYKRSRFVDRIGDGGGGEEQMAQIGDLSLFSLRVGQGYVGPITPYSYVPVLVDCCSYTW